MSTRCVESSEKILLFTPVCLPIMIIFPASTTTPSHHAACVCLSRPHVRLAIRSCRPIEAPVHLAVTRFSSDKQLPIRPTHTTSVITANPSPPPCRTALHTSIRRNVRCHEASVLGDEGPQLRGTGSMTQGMVELEAARLMADRELIRWYDARFTRTAVCSSFVKTRLFRKNVIIVCNYRTKVIRIIYSNIFV